MVAAHFQAVAQPETQPRSTELAELEGLLKNSVQSNSRARIVPIPKSLSESEPRLVQYREPCPGRSVHFRKASLSCCWCRLGPTRDPETSRQEAIDFRLPVSDAPLESCSPISICFCRKRGNRARLRGTRSHSTNPFPVSSTTPWSLMPLEMRPKLCTMRDASRLRKTVLHIEPFPLEAF